MKSRTHLHKRQQVECLSIREKIKEAQSLYCEYSDALAGDRGIRDLRDTLELRIGATKKLMLDLGVIAACKYCDEEDGGSCCGAGIENKYSPVLLLTNLVLGGTLPERRYSANSCYFLGERGCVLKVRHVLCVNYLCRKVQSMLTPEDLIRLQNAIGDELDTLFLLHERTKIFIRNGSNGKRTFR